jgi:hypothetical protein
MRIWSFPIDRLQIAKGVWAWRDGPYVRESWLWVRPSRRIRPHRAHLPLVPGLRPREVGNLRAGQEQSAAAGRKSRQQQ